MKSIRLKKIEILNFKGIKQLNVTFNDGTTEIMGANGSGKTTIFDAFTWVMFGKDSKDSKKFNLKTIDTNNDVIPKIPHEVTIWLDVNGEEIRLCRKLNEKWKKKNGEAEEKYSGNEEERLYNDVPCSVMEWSDKIELLCSEDVFKYITNPLYFTAQKMDVQRKMLFRMIGDVSDNAIADGNSDFTSLITSLNGKTIEEMKREIASKKRRLKADIDALPERIDERKRDAMEAEDWDAIGKEIEIKKKLMDSVQSQINDKTNVYMEKSKTRLGVSKELYDVKDKIASLTAKIKERVLMEYNDVKKKQAEIMYEIDKQHTICNRCNETIIYCNDYLVRLSEKRNMLIKDWKSIKAKKLIFGDDEFVCPTCKRPFDVDKIESMQREMTENFNLNKAKELKANENMGMEVKRTTNDMIERKSEEQKMIDNAQKKIDELENSDIIQKNYEMPNTTPIIKNNEEYKELIKRQDELQCIVDSPIGIPDNQELKLKKDALDSAIDELKERLGKKEIIDKNNKRIKELENQLRTQSDEYARLEKTEFTMAQFSKAKTEKVESKINGMFRFVKFKMYDKQINGGEAETCEAMVDGVPYSSLNNAMTINAGLDIINAICRSEQITAPIFIDNSESINKLEETESQVVKLTVTEDKCLTIK